MKHTPWSQEDAEKWARHYADSLHTLNCHTSKWQNARIDFLSGLEKAAEVIEKLKGMVSHYETCATVDRYDDEEVPCDCGLEKELAAIDKGEA